MNNVNKTPATMGTQHPDSASQYISIQEEADEAVRALLPQPRGWGIQEWMVDFEGKMTPYHQTAEIAHKLLAENLIPGEDVFITPRISSATEETVFRQLMALMSIIEADYDLVKSSGKGAIKEVILPMVKSADELMALRRRIADILDLAHKEFGLAKDPNTLQPIPLVESVPGMLDFPEMMKEYWLKASAEGLRSERFRYMIARSDSALSYGLVPSVLAVKLMLSGCHKVGQELGIEVEPILGGGALPFRGHISPENIENTVREYAGIRTITIQSGLRYDHDPEKAMGMINFIHQSMDKEPAILEGEQMAKDIIVLFSRAYWKEFPEIIKVAAPLSDLIPSQRDRLTRRGTFGYARSWVIPSELAPYAADEELAKDVAAMEAASLESIPRAITFTAALYSIGLPPEFLGTISGLCELHKKWGKEAVDFLLNSYAGLKNDLAFAEKFFHMDVAREFVGHKALKQMEENIFKAEELLEMSLFSGEDPAYHTLLEITEPLVREFLKGGHLSAEDQTLLRTILVRMGKQRGSLG